MLMYEVFYRDYRKRQTEKIAILTHSAAPSPVFKDGVRKRGSGSTLSKP